MADKIIENNGAKLLIAADCTINYTLIESLAFRIFGSLLYD